MEALHIGTINGLVALIGQRNVNRVLMQMGQNVGVKLLASVLIGGDQNLGDGFVNLCFVIQAKLGCVVTVLGARIAAREDCGSYGVPQQMLNTISKLPAFMLSR